MAEAAAGVQHAVLPELAVTHPGHLGERRVRLREPVARVLGAGFGEGQRPPPGRRAVLVEQGHDEEHPGAVREELRPLAGLGEEGAEGRLVRRDGLGAPPAQEEELGAPHVGLD